MISLCLSSLLIKIPWIEMYITFYLTTSLHHQGSKVETLEDVLAGPETEVMDAIQVATTAFVVVSPVKTVKNWKWDWEDPTSGDHHPPTPL